MTCKKGELSEKDIKKENANLSTDELSDVSGGKLYVEDGTNEDGVLLNPKGEDGRLLNPKGEDGRLLNPKGEDGGYLSSKGEDNAMYSPQKK